MSLPMYNASLRVNILGYPKEGGPPDYRIELTKPAWLPPFDTNDFIEASRVREFRYIMVPSDVLFIDGYRQHWGVMHVGEFHLRIIGYDYYSDAWVCTPNTLRGLVLWFTTQIDDKWLDLVMWSFRRLAKMGIAEGNSEDYTYKLTWRILLKRIKGIRRLVK